MRTKPLAWQARLLYNGRRESVGNGLGPLPQEPGSAVVLRQVLMQVEIAPAWIRHEAFFIDVN